MNSMNYEVPHCDDFPFPSLQKKVIYVGYISQSFSITPSLLLN